MAALAPLLSGLHAGTHHASFAVLPGEEHPACADRAPAEPTPAAPDRDGPAHDCRLCLQLAAAARHATTADPMPTTSVHPEPVGVVVMFSDTRRGQAVRLTSRPRAPPRAAARPA